MENSWVFLRVFSMENGLQDVCHRFRTLSTGWSSYPQTIEAMFTTDKTCDLRGSTLGAPSDGWSWDVSDVSVGHFPHGFHISIEKSYLLVDKDISQLGKKQFPESGWKGFWVHTDGPLIPLWHLVSLPQESWIQGWVEKMAKEVSRVQWLFQASIYLFNLFIRSVEKR